MYKDDYCEYSESDCTGEFYDVINQVPYYITTTDEGEYTLEFAKGHIKGNIDFNPQCEATVRKMLEGVSVF